METKEIILIICSSVTAINSVLWEINNPLSAIMRIMNMSIALILLFLSFKIVNGDVLPIPIYFPLTCSGLFSLLILLSKGQSFFSIVLRLINLVNLTIILFYLFP